MGTCPRSSLRPRWGPAVGPARTQLRSILPSAGPPKQPQPDPGGWEKRARSHPLHSELHPQTRKAAALSSPATRGWRLPSVAMEPRASLCGPSPHTVPGTTIPAVRAGPLQHAATGATAQGQTGSGGRGRLAGTQGGPASWPSLTPLGPS